MESTGDRHHAKNLNESVRNHAQLPKCVRLDVMFALDHGRGLMGSWLELAYASGIVRW